MPCIVRWSAGIPEGTVSSDLATAMDFYPTLASLAGHDTGIGDAALPEGLAHLFLGDVALEADVHVDAAHELHAELDAAA